MWIQDLPVYFRSIWDLLHEPKVALLDNRIDILIHLNFRFSKYSHKPFELIDTIASFKKNCSSDKLGKNAAH